MVWEESTERCESSQAEEASSRLSERPGYLCRFFPHNEAFFSTLLPELPLVSTFAGTGPTFPRIALETVTMVRDDLSMVVTDQKHDEQFFHEGSHV